MAGNTVKLHRVIKSSPEKVYKAFVDKGAMMKWYPPNGFTCQIHELDVREGGIYKMSFTNFSTGKSQLFGGKFVEIKPAQLIHYTDAFDDQKNLPGQIQVTITFKKNLIGTDLEITQSGLPEAIPVEFCYAGWQECLNQLANLVEPNIPDAV